MMAAVAAALGQSMGQPFSDVFSDVPLEGSRKAPERRYGDRPCRACGKPKVALWRKKGIDLCGKCYTLHNEDS